MSQLHEDPRLTAYALGELSGEEQLEIEALLARDARARIELEAIVEVQSRLERALAVSSSPALSARRRASLRAALAERRASTAPNGAAPKDTPAPAQRRAHSAKSRRRIWMLLAALVPAGVALLVFRADPKQDELVVNTLTVAQTIQLTASPPDVAQAAPDPERELLSTESERTAARAPVSSLLGPLAEGRVAAEQERWGALGDRASLSRRVPRGAAAHVEGLALSTPRATAALPPPELLREGSPRLNLGGDGAQRESYDANEDNPFVQVSTDPRSTFSVDVDTASYALVRRFLDAGSLPPRGAVRIEELVNYFSYRYLRPNGDAPVSVVASLGQAPWNPQHQLVRVALQARHVAASARPAANLVFLIDVSGSMAAPNKLELVKYGLRQLTRSLGAQDRVSIVTYAGNSGLVLAPTLGSGRSEILQAIDRLEAGGSTNGGAGIELAYSLARQHFVAGSVNRVLLATDGDFNVGVTSPSELVELVQRQAKTGVFLSVLGFGDGNYQDSMLEKLADRGNGNYAYIDAPAEAEKVLVEQATGTLLTLAKDVKLQLEFNPAEVAEFR
ncbi:MAG: von Willebrand factor type A domain-containing protein, partial [Deltaproteobacteria bacterium]